MRVKVELPTLPAIGPDVRDGQAAVGAYRDAVVERTRTGKGPRGASLGTYQSGPQAGQPVDLEQTGVMLGVWDETRTADGVQLTSGSPTAGFTHDRYRWADPDRAVAAAVERALDDAVRRRMEET